MLGKMPLTKKAHKKISCPRAGRSHLADLGKMVQEDSESGPGITFIEVGG
jgi:hypothetical protein